MLLCYISVSEVVLYFMCLSLSLFCDDGGKM